MPELGLDTLILDFGAGGVFGWIERLIDAQYETRPRSPERGREPELPAPCWLDEAARALIVDGARVRLTPLEFKLLRYLTHRIETVKGFGSRFRGFEAEAEG